MLWSLTKVVLFIAVVAALTFGAGLLVDTGGGLRIAFGGWEFTLGPLQSLIAALLLVAAVWVLMMLVGLLVAFLRFLTGDETAISRYFDRSRERRGFNALAEALTALASGEGRVAYARAIKAERLLGRPELTTLVAAQAAAAYGDTEKAKEAYKKLLENDRSRFVGIRGLMRLKLDEGDTETALKLARKAFELNPRHEETQDLLLRLQTAAGDWAGARATLGAKLKAGALPRDVFRRRDAVLALQEARGVLDESAPIEAREAAIMANKLSPDLIPAAAMAARGLAAKGDMKGAVRVLKKAWEARPHPDLAAAFADLVPDETPAERLKRFKALTAIRPDDDETRMLEAELLIAAEDFPGARRALGDVPTRHPTTRSLTLMAAIERGAGADEAVVRGWLARAVAAPRGPQWICEACNTAHPSWQPVCSNCGGFDTLAWVERAETAAQPGADAAMLPLLVGPQDKAAAAGQTGAAPPGGEEAKPAA